MGTEKPKSMLDYYDFSPLPKVKFAHALVEFAEQHGDKLLAPVLAKLEAMSPEERERLSAEARAHTEKYAEVNARLSAELRDLLIAEDIEAEHE